MVTPLRVVFFGTPEFAVPTLAALLGSSHTIVGVVTQPDRKRGRGQHVAPEAVKRLATEQNLPTLQPLRLADEGFLTALREMSPDLGVVVAYGRILTPAVLALPRLGLINVHTSLLPRWRGAAPIQRAILAGDETTGVTIMRVVQALDAGPILAASETAISANETSIELSARLARDGAGLLLETVNALALGRARDQPQDEARVTYAKRLEKHESRLDWARPALTVHNQIRGLQPWPMTSALLAGKRVTFVRSEVASQAPAESAPGTIVDVRTDALDVAAEPGAVRITEIQPDGRRAMPVAAFLAGHRVAPGDRFASLPDTA